MHTVLVWLLLYTNGNLPAPQVFPAHFATQQDCEAVGHQLKVLNQQVGGSSWSDYNNKCVSAKVIPTNAFTQG